MYLKGIKVGHSRSKANKRYTLAQAQALFGSDRSSIEEAYPGDVIGINNPFQFVTHHTQVVKRWLLRVFHHLVLKFLRISELLIHLITNPSARELHSCSMKEQSKLCNYANIEVKLKCFTYRLDTFF